MHYTLTKIEDNKRLDFLPKYFKGVALIQFEHFLYTVAEEKIKEYHGGFWDFYEIDIAGKKAPLMVLSTKSPTLTLHGFSEDIVVNAFTASLAVFSMALNHFMFHCSRNEKLLASLTNTYMTLNDYMYGDFEKKEEIDIARLYQFLD
ncbi:MAG: Unknown protein [uncultured Sulfurovum sp.]|uniref:Antirestriction protein n=1 Tax=uncultured Sulfurovum sp. TaxID=269237 RepID=A0A6S6SKA7_9BACT|nr:MAG: Unknown protein [uncultured Sulfurovum sp.]